MRVHADGEPVGEELLDDRLGASQHQLRMLLLHRPVDQFVQQSLQNPDEKEKRLKRRIHFTFVLFNANEHFSMFLTSYGLTPFLVSRRTNQNHTHTHTHTPCTRISHHIHPTYTHPQHTLTHSLSLSHTFVDVAVHRAALRCEYSLGGVLHLVHEHDHEEGRHDGAVADAEVLLRLEGADEDDQELFAVEQLVELLQTLLQSAHLRQTPIHL